MKKLMLVLAVAGVVAVWPASSGAATFKGVVVGKERGAMLVASPSGLVRAAAGRAHVGARVTVVANRVRVVGRARTAHLHGVVVRRIGAAVFLASNHHLVAMRTERTAAAPLKPGEVVATNVSIENGQLDENETETEDLGQEQAVQVQALVTAVAPGLLTVSVNNQSLTIRLPAGLTLPQSIVGQMVTVQLRLDQDNENENENEDNDNANDNDNDAPTGTVVGGGGTGGGGGDDGDHGGGHDDGGGDHGGGGDDGGGHH